MLRQRHKPNETITSIVKELDVFPKVEEDFQETSSARGTFSIIVFIIIFTLVLFEFRYYSEKELRYSYHVDFDHDSKLKMNVDITVAMPCQSIGADVLDSTSRDMLTDQLLSEEETWFEMSPLQKIWHDKVSLQNSIVRTDYHSIHQTMWKTKYRETKLPPREVVPDRPKDACRYYGTLELNKVAGNFHIIFGRSISFFGNHAHLTPLFDNGNYNFSHRIDHFSIGEVTAGIFYPLNADLNIAPDAMRIYQYFIQAVPTEIHMSDIDVDTYQYSVTEQERSVDHTHGSHGIPGIFFKYDISSIKIKIQETHKSYFEFLIRLIGIIGGIFATTAMFNASYESIKDFLCANMCGKPQTSKNIMRSESKAQKIITNAPIPEKNPLLDVDSNNVALNFLPNNSSGIQNGFPN